MTSISSIFTLLILGIFLIIVAKYKTFVCYRLPSVVSISHQTNTRCPKSISTPLHLICQKRTTPKSFNFKLNSFDLVNDNLLIASGGATAIRRPLKLLKITCAKEFRHSPKPGFLSSLRSLELTGEICPTSESGINKEQQFKHNILKPCKKRKLMQTIQNSHFFFGFFLSFKLFLFIDRKRFLSFEIDTDWLQ